MGRYRTALLALEAGAENSETAIQASVESVETPRNRVLDTLDTSLDSGFGDGETAKQAAKEGFDTLDTSPSGAFGDPEPVTCGTCRSFEPDHINPPGGLGGCGIDPERWRIKPPLYPFAERRCADWQERFEERAAIMEHDGGLTREEAERAAAALLQEADQ